MKNKKWVLLSIIAIIIVIVLFAVLEKKKRVNQFNFPATVVVVNHTNYKNADLMVKVIANRIFMYDTINVNIYYIQNNVSNEFVNIAGFIQKNQFIPHTYNIFLTKENIPVTTEVLISHEMVHLGQMERNELIQTSIISKLIYRGDTIDLKKISINLRPYEIDAYNKEYDLEKKLKSILYSK